jgi:hypothetical protein
MENIMNKKLLFLLLSFILTTFSYGDEHHHEMNHGMQDMPSTHGMFLFGSEKIYLSHLPMFHTPHDYQVLLEVKLPKSVKEKYLAVLKDNPQQSMFTIVPESFILPELVASKGNFMAQLFFGHFERGGSPFTTMVEFEITKVLYFKKFEKTASQPKEANYILIGNEVEQFLVHSITSKPDFDQIAKVEITNKQIIKDLLKTNHITLEFNNIENMDPLQEKQLIKYDKSIFKVLTSLYLEFGDLSF